MLSVESAVHLFHKDKLKDMNDTQKLNKRQRQLPLYSNHPFARTAYKEALSRIAAHEHTFAGGIEGLRSANAPLFIGKKSSTTTTDVKYCDNEITKSFLKNGTEGRAATRQKMTTSNLRMLEVGRGGARPILCAGNDCFKLDKKRL